MKKSSKILLFTGISTLVLAGGVAAGVVINNKNNTSTSVTSVKTQSSASKFKFRTYNDETLKEINSNNFDYVAPSRITKEFKSGHAKRPTVSTKNNKEVIELSTYQSNYYYNQRDFMPIFSSERMYNYPNERETMSAIYGTYYGWDKTEQYYNIDGSISNKDNSSIIYRNYTPFKELVDWVKDTESKDVKKLIKGVELDCTKFDSVQKINSYLEIASQLGIEFVTIKTPSQQTLEKIVVPNGIKKLTIIDYNKQYQSSLTSLRGITIPESVVELEFYSNTCSRIDPLILSSSTHMIYDHIDDANYGIRQANFKTIDLSSHKDLNEAELQRAIDIIYIERQFERNFQGDFVGGYMYQLDISNTPIKTLNNVTIPSQSDGRFNIAYVKWTSNTQSGEISININNSSKPSNDSLVGEWNDNSENANNVKKLVVSTEEQVSIELAKTEILGQIKKYPNINEVDLSNVELLDNKTLDDLIDLINNSLVDPMTGELITEINFIK
ncbi:MAG: IgG-blocking protein M [Ureaplasma sp.]|nr:IgG-blocking protein M [Ureaplasma sp.]